MSYRHLNSQPLKSIPILIDDSDDDGNDDGILNYYTF